MGASDPKQIPERIAVGDDEEYCGLPAEGFETWPCTSCTYQNSCEKTVCGMCETAKPQDAKTPQTKKTNAEDGKMSGFETWQCPHCTLQNSPGRLDCLTCKAKRPHDENHSQA